jgi:hypothetical protein
MSRRPELVHVRCFAILFDYLLPGAPLFWLQLELIFRPAVGLQVENKLVSDRVAIIDRPRFRLARQLGPRSQASTHASNSAKLRRARHAWMICSACIMSFAYFAESSLRTTATINLWIAYRSGDGTKTGIPPL